MAIETIAAIGAVSEATPFLAPAAAAPAPEGFGAWFAQEIDSVNANLAVATTDAHKLALGEAPSLHEVMIHMEEAKLSFQLLAQVRNHLLESYQEVMRMQV